MTVVEIYTEETPNPESLKFVTNQHLLPNYVAEFKTKESAGESELAQALFTIPFVQSVFLSNNFVTITKTPDVEWYEITPELRDKIRGFLSSGKKAVSETLWNKGGASVSGDTESSDPQTKIIALLDKYVKPAVEGDGGHISFRSFENGVVSVALQGSCSGCPSSSITLKNGIEGLLKRMVPEVQEVVAIAE
ncbi:MAG: NifU family protein [Chitinophagales bacterium]